VIDLLIRRGVPDYIRLDDDAKLRRKTPGVWLAEVDARTFLWNADVCGASARRIPDPRIVRKEP